MNNKSNGVAYHEELAVEWDGRYQSGSFQRRANLFKGQLLPLVPQGGKWLDAGCGSGYFSRILAKNDAEVIGLDASENMIRQARNLASSEWLTDIRFDVVASIETLVFDDVSFDGCICLSVLEYLPNPLECLDELVRILKPGGYLILSVPHRQSVVRLMQKTIRTITQKKDNTSLDYLESSQFQTTPHNIQNELADRQMEVLKLTGFDVVVPNSLHKLLPPSLIYIVAKKTEKKIDKEE